MNSNEKAILAKKLCKEYQEKTGLMAVYSPVMNRVQLEHPQPGVSHPEEFVTVTALQFIDNFNIYVAGKLPE